MESKEGELIITGYVVGGNTEDRSQKTEVRETTVKSKKLKVDSEEEAISTETTNHEQRLSAKALASAEATSDGLFPPEEGPPVPPPSMYTGISTLITRYLYTGREYNIETGMYYYRARVINSRHGRFTGKDLDLYDPLDFEFKTNLSINLYLYVNNCPMDFTDKTGLGWQEDVEGFAKKYLNYGQVTNDSSSAWSYVGKWTGGSENCQGYVFPGQTSAWTGDVDFVFTGRDGWVKIYGWGKMTIHGDGSYTCWPPFSCRKATKDEEKNDIWTAPKCN